MFDSSRSSKRPDLSRIHPLKRVILIGFLFLFGTSIALAIGLQFVYVHGTVIVPRFVVAVGCLNKGLGMAVQSIPAKATLPSFGVRFGSQRYSEHKEHPGLYSRGALLPGISFFVDDNAAHGRGYHFSIHHAWLITLTGSLYFLTRWRIRGSARLQQSAAAPSPSSP